jgi:hypothetical protein
MFKLKYVHLLICIFMILLLCIVLFNKCNRNNVCDKFTVGAPCTFGAGAAQDTGDAARAGDAALDAGTDAGADGEAEYEAEQAAECERLCIERTDMSAYLDAPFNFMAYGPEDIAKATLRLERANEAISDVGCLCGDADEAILDQAVADEPVADEPVAEEQALCDEAMLERDRTAEQMAMTRLGGDERIQRCAEVRRAALSGLNSFQLSEHRQYIDILCLNPSSQAARDAREIAMNESREAQDALVGCP